MTLKNKPCLFLLLQAKLPILMLLTFDRVASQTTTHTVTPCLYAVKTSHNKVLDFM